MTDYSTVYVMRFRMGARGVQVRHIAATTPERALAVAQAFCNQEPSWALIPPLQPFIAADEGILAPAVPAVEPAEGPTRRKPSSAVA